MGMYGFSETLVDCQSAEDGLTKQSPSKSCDINYIVAQYRKTGMLPINVKERTPVYADVSEFADYFTAMNLVCKANQMFEALPVLVRERFDNDPAKMVAFIEDEANREEATKLGMLEASVLVGQPGAPKAGPGGVSTPGGVVGAPEGAPASPKAS